VPALLGYLLVRPGEHPLVRRHIVGVRLLVLGSGSIPVVAAIVLLANQRPDASDVQPVWIGLTVIAWLIAGGLTLSWFLPSKALHVSDMPKPPEESRDGL